MRHYLAVAATWYVFGMVITAMVLLFWTLLALGNGWRPPLRTLLRALVEGIVIWPCLIYAALWFAWAYFFTPQKL